KLRSCARPMRQGFSAWISRPGDVCRRWNSAVGPDLARPRTRVHCGSRSVSTTVAANRADARNARPALADGVALVPGHELLLDRRNRRLPCSICAASITKKATNASTLAGAALVHLLRRRE